MSRMRTRCKREWKVNDSWYIGCYPKDTAKIRWTNCVLQIFSQKMQKKMHFSYFLATRARLIHFSTFPRIAVPWFLAHNNYIIYNIIILLWGFYQPTRMCGNVKLWKVTCVHVARRSRISSTFFLQKWNTSIPFTNIQPKNLQMSFFFRNFAGNSVF